MRRALVLVVFFSAVVAHAQPRPPLTRALADALYAKLAGGSTIAGTTTLTNLAVTGTCTGCGSGVAWGAITGTLSSQTDLQSALNLKAPLASPTFTGHVTVEGVTATGATGTGRFVFDASPTLITPALGTPSAAVGTNFTGIPESGVTNLTSDLGAKQATGNYITALTGDGTASGPGSVAFTLASLLTAGSCTSCNLTFDAKGRITVAGNGSAGGLATDGSTTGATSVIQPFTNGLKTAATTGLVGIGMAPVAMLDLTAPSGITAIQAVGTTPANAPSGPGSTGGPTLNLIAQDGGSTSSTTANRTGGSGGNNSIVTGNGGDETGASSGTARGGNGGSLSLTIGNGGNSTNASGTGKGGAGGLLTFQLGNGGTSATGVGGAASTANFVGANGGITTGAAKSGKGTTFNFTGGNGGNNSNAAGTAGDSGDMSIDTGTAGVNSGGAAAGTGGVMSLGVTNAKTITAGNASSSLTLNGSIVSGTALQHIRTASCTTGITINASCDTTITWPVAFADANYTATALLDTPSGGLVFILSTKSKTTTTMVVTLVTLTAAASSGTINAIGIH